MTDKEIQRAAEEILFYLERKALADRGEKITGELVEPPILKAIQPPKPIPWTPRPEIYPSGISAADAGRILDIVGTYRKAEGLI